MSSDFAVASCAYSAAVKGFLALDRAAVGSQTDILSTALEGPIQWDTKDWLLNGPRMRMFFAWECRDGAAVALEAAAIDEICHRKGAGEWLRKYAVNWARGWQYEIEGEHDAALSTREIACREGASRAKTLAGRKTLLPGERSEAQLLVDVFADLLRTARVCSSPALALGRINQRFRDPIGENNVYTNLARHRVMGGWSQRRALLRVAYEAADRQDGRQLPLLTLRRRTLERITRLDAYRDCPLARLEQPMIAVEKHFASNVTGTDAAVIEALRDEAKTHAQAYGLRRRSEALDLLWPRIFKHGSII